MKTFFLPPGYRVELVAAEPMIQEPVLVDFDPQGRLWVVEMIGYMQDMAATTEREPLGRISVLEDTNADGQMDKKTVFLDQLVLPRALKVLDRGVLVAEPPNLWLAKDTNGDLRADTKELVTNTYGRLEANVEHNANSSALGPRQLDAHVRNRRLPAAEEGRVRSPEDALARPVGRVAGRCRHGSIATRTSRCCTSISCRRRTSRAIRTCCGRAAATSRSAARTTKSTRCGRCGRRRASIAAIRPACCGRTAARRLHGRQRADGLSRRRPAGGAPRQRLRRRARRQPRQPDPRQTTTARSSSRRKAYERRRVPHLDRRALPPGQPVERPRRHALHRRHVSRHHPASRLHHRVPARSDPVAEARGRRSAMGASIGRARDDEAGRTAPAPPSTPAELVHALSHPNGWWRDTAQRLLVERGEICRSCRR